MKNIRKTTWNTYRVAGYTYNVSNDQASAGGIHIYQIRKTNLGWQYRICQSNGQHQSYSEVLSISDADGENKFEMAKRY